MAPNLYGNTMLMPEPSIEDDKPNHGTDNLNTKSDIVKRSCNSVSI